MKILFINHNYKNFGTYWRCYNLAKYLSFKGVNIDLVCASNKNIDLKISIHRENNNFRIITLPRIRFHEYHTGHNLRGLINSELVLIKDYDILHVFAVAQPATALPALANWMFRRKPAVVDWDDIWAYGFGLYHPGIIHKLLYFNERFIPKVADKITVVSDYLRDKAVSYGYSLQKIVKIPNAANIDMIKPMDKYSARKILNISKKDKIVLSMGHTYMGNINMFMAMVNETKKIDPEIKFYLIGNIGSAGKDLNGDERLIITGEQPFSKIPYYLASADVLMLPMGQSDIEKARWPIRFGDYLSSGRPIISNAVGEVKKILEEEGCGINVNPEDIIGFSHALINLLKDQKLQEILSRKARFAAEKKYSWQIVTDSLIKIYEELL